MSWRIARSVIHDGDATKDYWKNEYKPGETVPVSGIFRCTGCGREDVCNKEDPFPPQSHHQHSPSQGNIRWKLNVRSNPGPA